MHKAMPMVAAAIAGILVGAGIVATRFVIGQTDPASLALLRYVIGVILLLPVALMAGPLRFARRDILPIALLGITQFGILIALLNFGLRFISSGLGALIFATFPLLTMLFAAALRYEALTLYKSLGVLLTIVGVAFALGESLFGTTTSSAAWLGALAVLASAASGAICSVFYRPYLTRYPVLPVSTFAMLASVVFLAVLAAAEGFFAEVPRFTPAGWGAVAFIGVSSAVGYYLWLWALQNTTPTRVTIFLALSPVTATALGAGVLGEPVTLLFLLGLICVALGLWLANRPGRDPAG